MSEPKKILHLVTQRDQPYGSVRRCCEKCGLGTHKMEENFLGFEHGFVCYKPKYDNKEFHPEYFRCNDTEEWRSALALHLGTD